ncbi:MAG TPA: PIN domain-containing protein [Tepidisphaeraceae bacterium]|jgi:uncharacterized protein YacL|nr:PIN domain-containing protein [Tepidisphaeraceae bacterium]
MVLQVLRALFVLLMAAIGWFYLSSPQSLGSSTSTWLVMPITLTVGVLFVCIDILSPRRKLAVFSGAILGLLVGVAIAFSLSFVVKLLVDQFAVDASFTQPQHEALVSFLNVVIGTVCCYLSISFVLQTRDDFRFIIPYVEFSRQQKGPRAMVLDTSVLIDGRIADIAQTGILEGQVIVPQFIVDELQAVADSSDKLKRARGRRGLDVLAKLRADSRLEIKSYDVSHFEAGESVDHKLIRLGKELNARVVTNDYNLNKVAQLDNVDVVNINDLAAAMKPAVLPGEKMFVRIVRGGEEPGQGVGFLDDGTMVVVEQAKNRQNEEVEFTVSRALQTSAGRMIFGRVNADAPARGGRM